MQACFDLPLPPNLIMSRQALHLPQSANWHTSHTPHLLLLGAETALSAIWSLKNCSNTLRTRGVVVACSERERERERESKERERERESRERERRLESALATDHGVFLRLLLLASGHSCSSPLAQSDSSQFDEGPHAGGDEGWLLIIISKFIITLHLTQAQTIHHLSLQTPMVNIITRTY